MKCGPPSTHPLTGQSALTEGARRRVVDDGVCVCWELGNTGTRTLGLGAASETGIARSRRDKPHMQKSLENPGFQVIAGIPGPCGPCGAPTSTYKHTSPQWLPANGFSIVCLDRAEGRRTAAGALPGWCLTGASLVPLSSSLFRETCEGPAVHLVSQRLCRKCPQQELSHRSDSGSRMIPFLYPHSHSVIMHEAHLHTCANPASRLKPVGGLCCCKVFHLRPESRGSAAAAQVTSR